MTDDPPFTKAEYEIALGVIEDVREALPTDYETKQMNDAHYSLQLIAERYEDEWEVGDKESATTPLTLREIVRGTVAEQYWEAGYDLVDAEWLDGALELGWRLDHLETDGGENPAEPATPDDVPDECEIPWCDGAIESFPEAFFPPEQYREHADETGRMVLCDQHYAAARILSMTRPEPPYVDVGLYQECCYYARALAAVAFDIEPESKVTAPQNVEDENE